MFLFYFLYFELLSLIISLIFIRKLWGSTLFYFIPFLLLTNIQEWGSYYGLMSIHGNNSLSLNIFTNIEFSFYSWFLSKHTDSRTHRKRIYLLTAAYLIVAMINMIFIQGVFRFHSYTYLLGSLLIVYYVCFFFYELFNKEEYINLLRYPVFWICVGLLFFYLGMFVYYAFFELVATEYVLKYIKLFNVLMNIFNIILYSCFSMAFICHKSKRSII